MIYTPFQIFDRFRLEQMGATIYDDLSQVPRKPGRYKIQCLTIGCQKINNIRVRKHYSGMLVYIITSCHKCGMLFCGGLVK